MLSEITGSLRATNVRDNIVRDISTPYISSSTVNIVGGEHCQMNSHLPATIWSVTTVSCTRDSP